MNQKNRAKASSLFLLELILAILFFSIASAVCVQIFVKSHLLSSDAQALNMAVSECSGAAEVILSSKDEHDAAALLKSAYPDGSFSESDGGVTSSVFLAYYDEDLAPCGKSAASYEMTVQLIKEDHMLQASISMTSLDDPEDANIYALDVAHHIMRGGQNE